MKFGQLIKYNAGNVFFVFLEYHTQNVVEKLFLDPFLKIQNWAYLRINGPKFYSLFLLYAKPVAIKIYWN